MKSYSLKEITLSIKIAKEKYRRALNKGETKEILQSIKSEIDHLELLKKQRTARLPKPSPGF